MSDLKKETGFMDTGFGKLISVTVDAGKDVGTKAMDIVQDSFSGAFGAATEKAQTDRENLHKNKYNGFFSSGFETMRHPENLFSQNQKNGIVFYIQVRKNSVAAANDAVGTADAAIAASGLNAGFIRGPQTEQDTEINRTSADIDAIGRIGTGTGAVSGLAAGLGFFNGNGKSKFGEFINKGTKVAGAVIAGAVGGKVIAEMNTAAETVFLQKVIQLHIPQAVVTQYQADWNPEELGLAGALAGRRTSQTAIAETGELLGRGIISAAANIPRAAGLGNADFGGAIEAATRKTNNPFKEQLFKSIGFRKFAFNYIFSPKNAGELAHIEEIIKHFKYHMLPEISPGQMFLTYPSEFQMEFLHTDKDGIVNTNLHMPRISGCALTDVKVVYGPDGAFQTIKGTGGAPSEITMQLSFVELETLTANRIADGF